MRVPAVGKFTHTCGCGRATSSGWIRGAVWSLRQIGAMAALNRHVCGIGLVDSRERVCLDCIRNDQAEGRRPYGRLLWRIAAVKCCPDHRSALVPTRCSRASGPRRGHATLRCRKAGECLQCGSIGFECVQPSEEPISDADVWRAQACRQLLACLPEIEKADPLTMKDALIAHCHRLDGKSALARRVNATKSSISRWLNHRSARMSLPQLLDIAVSEGFELHKMLLGDLGQSRPAPSREPVRVRRPYRYLDHHELEQSLIIAIRDKGSLPEVAKRLDVDQTSLAKHRELYSALRDDHRQRREQADIERQDDAIRQAADIVRRALRDGRPASLRRASELTGTHWRGSQLRASALTLLRIELGDPVVTPPLRTSVFSDRFIDRIKQAAGQLEAEVSGENWRLAA